MVASNESMYDSIKLKLVYVSPGAPRLFDGSSGWSDRPFTFCRQDAVK